MWKVVPLYSRNVLLCLRYGIGDVVMELPTISALREALPHARITALANPPADELLDRDPRIDAVVATSRWTLRHRWDKADAQTRAAIGRWVAGEDFDVIIDAVHAVSAVEACIRELDVPVFDTDQSAENAALAAGAGGVASIIAGARAGWGLAISSHPQPQLHIPPDHHAIADRLLRDLGLRDERPFVICPVASHELKRWPLDRFAGVADRIAAEWGAPVLVIEGPDEESGRRLVAAMRYPGSAARLGSQHLLSTAAVLQRCRAIVCNDTGIMHIASAAGVPTVAVFGPTLRETFLPPAANAFGIGSDAVECRYRAASAVAPPACWTSNECLLGIGGCIDATSVDEVVARLRRVLRSSQRPMRRVARRRVTGSIG